MPVTLPSLNRVHLDRHFLSILQARRLARARRPAHPMRALHSRSYCVALLKIREQTDDLCSPHPCLAQSERTWIAAVWLPRTYRKGTELEPGDSLLQRSNCQRRLHQAPQT